MAKALDTDSVLSIDMVVIMPTSVLQEKDYLNYRYFYKRAYYLACIAAGLQEAAQDEFVIKFKYLNDNDLHPIICITSKSGNVNCTRFRITYANHNSRGRQNTFTF
jgi:hypothetical protein